MRTHPNAKRFTTRAMVMMSTSWHHQANSTLIFMFAVLATALLWSSGAQAFTVTVDPPGAAGFRWLVEEDTFYESVPGVEDPNSLSVSFHTSYAPVVAKGHSDTDSAVIDLPDTKRYFVSILPDSGYTLSGTSVAVGQADVTVTVNEMPIPTAQVTVFVFEDNAPLNNSPDLPNEQGLEGFKIVLEDAGGKYGITAGQQMMDAFGNMIGTTYDTNGNVLQMGDGFVLTDADGRATIKNLSPGKYGIQAVPPTGGGWHQTTTIEGTKIIDAWLKANEPPYFIEIGPPGPHVFIGFVQEINDTSVLTGGGSITGHVISQHLSRPPEYTVYPGNPFPGTLIGLNDMSVGNGTAVYVGLCDDNGNFTIPNVPAGDYQLFVFDENLDIIFGLFGVITDGTNVDLGEVTVPSWFARTEQYVFDDTNENGFWDPGELPLTEQATNLRFRDGTVYQSIPTDLEGAAPYDEVFPFFHWQVAEVDYARLKATGATFIVDDGGEIPPHNGWDTPSFDVLNPQPQYEADGVTAIINPNTGNNLSRTDLGPVLTQGYQVFQGQTNIIQWGKSTYDIVDVDNPPMGNFPSAEDEDFNGNGLYDPSNGGITGIVYYAVTRAENDPRFAAGEPWEPGIPRVQVNLYADADQNGVIDDLSLDGVLTRADVNNYPFDNFPGPEDVDRNGNTIFDLGDAMSVTTTDSWDDSIPTNIQGPDFYSHGVLKDGLDGLRNFNQLRPGVFDGGYAFASHYLRTETGEVDVEVDGVPEGVYIVEAVAPPGYEHVKEEDKNVDFGEEYIVAAKAAPVPAPDLFVPAPPVGDLHLVPAELSLFPGVPCEFAGQMRPLPDRKQVKLSRGLNAACDFFLFTEVPIAAHIVGFTANDLQNAFDPNSPNFGEKAALPWIPISVQDWQGNEITRTYSDEWGAYNVLVPSTFTVNIPSPSGVSPNMLTVVMNHPGPILDQDPLSPTFGEYITDPYFSRQHAQLAFTLQFMPGSTTYLDTPVVPVSAFAGQQNRPLDCEFDDGTPVIWSVAGGPYVAATGQVISIASAGPTEVTNPLYTPGGAAPLTITRDYGFGDVEGTVTIGGVPLTGVTWTDGAISGTVAGGTTTGQLEITRGDNGKSTVMGLTFTVGPIDGSVNQVVPDPAGTPIQDAIDAAAPGDLILVAPGTYDESVIMWKPVQLQGWGAFSTIINAVVAPTEKAIEWQNRIEVLINQGLVDLLPGQELNFSASAPVTLYTEELAGILVLARNVRPANGGFGAEHDPRIDGLTITGATQGGGIVVNGYAHYLEIGNNRIENNLGYYGGGIRVGHALLTLGEDYVRAHNDHIRIHHNHIAGNGGQGGAGGGVSLYTGSDYYEVSDNLICGNQATANGAGIGHLGLSESGVIANNTIVFNEAFNQGLEVSGGGIFVGGQAPLVNGELTTGSGTVHIISNLIQGNHVGSGDGGGIFASGVNGTDVAQSPDNPENWHTLFVLGNIIANNVAGLAGAGISLQDTASSVIIGNTIVHNDTTATAGLAFPPGNPNLSTPQPAGVVSRAHSATLAAAFGTAPAVATLSEFSNPEFTNNIIWENRSFYYYQDELMVPPIGLLPDPSTPVFDDLAVIGADGSLNPLNSVLTDTTGYDGSNVSTTPNFVREYFNGSREVAIVQPNDPGPLLVAAAADEGGNFIDVQYGPLTLINPATGLPFGDYRIDAGGGNIPPVAVADVYVVTEDQVLNVPAPGVLGNDTDDDGDALTAETTLATEPSHGSATLSADGSFTYTPDGGYSGFDAFDYEVTDGTDSDIGTVLITVEAAPTGGNQAPVPTASAIAIQINSEGTSRVLPNDPDFDDVHTYAITTQPTNGSAAITVTGIVTYTPNADYVGSDSITVTVTDELGAQGSVVISVTVADSVYMPPGSDYFLQFPPDTDGIDTDGDGIVDNDNVMFHLGAGDGYIRMADGRLQYMFGFGDLTNVAPENIMMEGPLGAEFPAPTLRMREGQHVYLNLTNVGMVDRPDLFDPHTVHFHGFPQAAPVFDGVPDSSVSVNMGSTLTYYYEPHDPGTYMYHCHVEATEHMQMGMLGNLFVTPKQDGTSYEYPVGSGRTYTQFAYNDGDGSTGYDVDYPIQMGSFDREFHDASMNVQPLPFALMKDDYAMLNGRGYPDTVNPGVLTPPTENGSKDSQLVSSLITATRGERILIRLSNLNVTQFYTLSSPNIPMQVVGRDARQLVSTTGEHLYFKTNSVTLGGGQALDIIIDTLDAPAGQYTLHTTNLQYLSNYEEDFGGMMTEIHITE